MKNTYFKALAKCGHVGKNKYILKIFYVKAESGKDAAKIVRGLPRVKHHHKDAIRGIEKITYDKYLLGKEETKKDLYFHVKNSTEQRSLGCVNPKDVFREEKAVKFKNQRNGQRNKYLAKEKEWKKIKCYGVEDYA